jgi:hypothetical protein
MKSQHHLKLSHLNKIISRIALQPRGRRQVQISLERIMKTRGYCTAKTGK